MFGRKRINKLEAEVVRLQQELREVKANRDSWRSLAEERGRQVPTRDPKTGRFVTRK